MKTWKRAVALAALAAVALWACTSKADGLPGWEHRDDKHYRCAEGGGRGAAATCVDLKPARARMTVVPPHGVVLAMATARVGAGGQLEPLQATFLVYCDVLLRPVAWALLPAQDAERGAPVPWLRPEPGSVSDYASLLACVARRGGL